MPVSDSAAAPRSPSSLLTGGGLSGASLLACRTLHTLLPATGHPGDQAGDLGPWPPQESGRGGRSFPRTVAGPSPGRTRLSERWGWPGRLRRVPSQSPLRNLPPDSLLGCLSSCTAVTSASSYLFPSRSSFRVRLPGLRSLCNGFCIPVDTRYKHIYIFVSLPRSPQFTSPMHTLHAGHSDL